MSQFDEKSCGAVIFKIEQDQNLYLTVEYKKEKGYWGLVKGHVEPGETELETAKREIYEEVGLTDLRFFDGFRGEISYQPKAGVTKQVIFFLAQANHDKVEYLWGEHIAHLWLPADEVIPRLKYDGDREIIRQAEAFLSRGAGEQVRIIKRDTTMLLWNLDDNTKFFKLLSVRLPFVLTWGDKDLDKREQIRQEVAKDFPQSIPDAQWWAFRIYAEKKIGGREFDIENVPKLIIDALCKRQIERDNSRFRYLALYEDDTISHIRLVQAGGEMTNEDSSTTVEIFGRRL